LRITFVSDRLLEALPEARLLVSVASRDATRLPVALGYAQAAQALGVSVERIVVLDTPTDTAQEAYAVRELLGTEARFLLVTSASHMRRSVQHFERVGLTPIASPTHVLTGRGRPDRLSYWVPSSDALRKTERAVYETLGLWALEWDHRGRYARATRAGIGRIPGGGRRKPNRPCRTVQNDVRLVVGPVPSIQLRAGLHAAIAAATFHNRGLCTTTRGGHRSAARRWQVIDE